MTQTAQNIIKLPSVDYRLKLYTPQGAAFRVILEYGDKIRFVDGKTWIYDGKRWSANDNGEGLIIHWIGDRLKAWRNEPEADERKIDGLASKLTAIKSWIKEHVSLNMTRDQFDTNPYLLNCANGTVDLVTGIRRDHDPLDYITKLCPTHYEQRTDAEVEASEFYQSSARMFPHATHYLQDVIGTMLLGNNQKKLFLYVESPPDFGKTKWLTALAHVIGKDYYGSFPARLVTHRSGGDCKRGSTSTYDAMNANKHIVFVSETEAGSEVDLYWLKKETGESLGAQDDKFEKADVSINKYSIIFDSNHRLRLPAKSDEEAVYKRLVLLIAKAKGYVDRVESWDRVIAEKEGSQILSYLVNGCVRGLTYTGKGEVPQGVLDDEQALIDERDPIATFCKTVLRVRGADRRKAHPRWVEDSAMSGYSQRRGDRRRHLTSFVYADAVYKLFETFCEENGHGKFGKSNFLKAVEKCLGIKKRKGTAGAAKGVNIFDGLGYDGCESIAPPKVSGVAA